MKQFNFYITIFLVLFMTIFAFFNMFWIVELSKDIIDIIINNLLPSLLPFMVLMSLCLNLGLLNILGYLIQKPFYWLFHLTPIMSAIYFVSFFCGYPTNVKIIKEAFELNYINLDELQHLLSIASFASFSFIFVSLKNKYCLLIYLAHIIPSIIKAFNYSHCKVEVTFADTINLYKNTNLNFISIFKSSITSSIYTFIFIFGYMLVFQFLSLAIGMFINNSLINDIILGVMEFSSGSLRLLKYPLSPLILSCIAFNLSFSGFSVLMQSDNLLEDVDYNFNKLALNRLIHGILSFILCLIFCWLLKI